MNKLYYGMVASRVKKALEDSGVASEYDNQVLKGRAREIFVSDLLVPFLDKSFGVCTDDFSSLEHTLRQNGVSKEDIRDLHVALQADDRPKLKGHFGPKVSAWVSGMIRRKSLSNIYYLQS